MKMYIQTITLIGFLYHAGCSNQSTTDAANALLSSQKLSFTEVTSNLFDRKLAYYNHHSKSLVSAILHGDQTEQLY